MFDPLSTFRLDGKVVIITGASSGLGARFARVCDAAGASLVLAARRVERLESLANGLSNAVVVRADLAHDEAVPAIIEAALSEFGAIDVVVNNAGISRTVKAAVGPGAAAVRRIWTAKLLSRPLQRRIL